MATKDHTGAHCALKQLIKEQRAKLISAQAVQQCLYEALLYAEGEDSVAYAEAAHVVATLMEEILDRLDCVNLHGSTSQTRRADTPDRAP